MMDKSVEGLSEDSNASNHQATQCFERHESAGHRLGSRRSFMPSMRNIHIPLSMPTSSQSSPTSPFQCLVCNKVAMLPIRKDRPDRPKMLNNVSASNFQYFCPTAFMVVEQLIRGPWTWTGVHPSCRPFPGRRGRIRSRTFAAVTVSSVCPSNFIDSDSQMLLLRGRRRRTSTSPPTPLFLKTLKLLSLVCIQLILINQLYVKHAHAQELSPIKQRRLGQRQNAPSDGTTNKSNNRGGPSKKNALSGSPGASNANYADSFASYKSSDSFVTLSSSSFTSSSTTSLSYATLTPSDDATIFQSQSSQHLESSNSQSLLFSHDAQEHANDIHSLIKFDLAFLEGVSAGVALGGLGDGSGESGDFIAEAKLKLCNMLQTDSSGEGVIISPTEGYNWSEDSVTWDLAPKANSVLQAILIGTEGVDGTTASGQRNRGIGKGSRGNNGKKSGNNDNSNTCLWDVYDVTTLVKVALSEGMYLSLRIESIYEHVNAYSSKENKNGRFPPTLEVYFSEEEGSGESETDAAASTFNDGSGKPTEIEMETRTTSTGSSSTTISTITSSTTTTIFSGSKGGGGGIASQMEEQGGVSLITQPTCANEQGELVEAWEDGAEYSAGSYASVADLVYYECKPFPFDGWCSKYQPGVGSWRDAWIYKGECGTAKSGSSTNGADNDGNGDGGGGSDYDSVVLDPLSMETTSCPISEYTTDTDTPYKAEDRVSYQGNVYSCQAFPMDQWCSLPGYEPGNSAHWTLAWNDEGPCSELEDLELLQSNGAAGDGGEDAGPPKPPCAALFQDGYPYSLNDEISYDRINFVCRKPELCALSQFEPAQCEPDLSNPIVPWEAKEKCSGDPMEPPKFPTTSPTTEPTASPTATPTTTPTVSPTVVPTNKPTKRPTSHPTEPASPRPRPFATTSTNGRPVTNGVSATNSESATNNGSETDGEASSKVESPSAVKFPRKIAVELANAKPGIESKVLQSLKASGVGYEASTLYHYDDLVKALVVMNEYPINDQKFYFGDDSESAHLYGLVNIAAFLAQSMTESIKYDACDEASWDFVDNKYPLSNACGQGGDSYQDLRCPVSERHMECKVVRFMSVKAVTNAKWIGGADGAPGPLYCTPNTENQPFSGIWDHLYQCNNPDADPPEYCSEYPGQRAGRYDNSFPAANSAGREDIEGCCWWGRGVIQAVGICNIGKLNFFLGSKAAKDGRSSPFPSVDFCEDPEVICASEEFKELRWVAGMASWIERVQSYNNGGWDYITELRKFVDDGMVGESFILSVSAVLTSGRHDTINVSGADERGANFKTVLDVLGIDLNGSTASKTNPPKTSSPTFMPAKKTKHPTSPPTLRPTTQSTRKPKLKPAPTNAPSEKSNTSSAGKWWGISIKPKGD